MKLGSLTLSFISLALLMGLNETKANAQITFPFEATYNTQRFFEQIQNDVFKLTVTGESTDAPYGLTNFIRMNYIERSIIGVESTDPDATAFGIEGLPILTDTFFGSGNDKLFASTSTTVLRNFEDVTISVFGTTTIVGGEGNFQGATGTLTLSENATFNPNIGTAVISGSFTVPQRVPEAGNNTTLVGIGIIGASLSLRQRLQARC